MTPVWNLALDHDEQLLRDTARAFAAERTPVAAMRRLRDSGDPLGFDRPLWEEMAALGWAGLPFPAAVGGSDAGCFALGVVMEELGRTLAATPLLSTLLAGSCLIGSGSAAAEKVLAETVEGRALVALAWEEGQGDFLSPTTVAHPVGDAFRLEGRKVLVIDGGCADSLVVSARCGTGVGLFLVETLSEEPVSCAGSSESDRTADGPARPTTRLVDSRRYATVDLSGLQVRAEALIARPATGEAILTQALDRGAAVLAAGMVGIMSAALDLTVLHLKERRQFGVPIGSFQALQHRAARMYVAVETARSVVADALRALDAGAEDAPLRVSTAKAMANEASRLVTSEAVQMHGGMGITDEADIGLYLKHARVAELTLGDTGYHRRRFATLSGF